MKFFVSDDQIQIFFLQNELKMNMSSLLNVFNGSNKPEEKNSGISIIAKNNEKEEYLYMSIWDQIVIED